MIAAYMLIQTEVGRVHEVATAVAQFPGVREVAEVIGSYDVIARLEAADVDSLGRDIVTAVHSVPGITRTQTCTVFG